MNLFLFVDDARSVSCYNETSLDVSLGNESAGEADISFESLPTGKALSRNHAMQSARGPGLTAPAPLPYSRPAAV